MNPSLSDWPTSMPSESPSSSQQPSEVPSTQLSSQPSLQPSLEPTFYPTQSPTSSPTSSPSVSPSKSPTSSPSSSPSVSPTSNPTSSPSGSPTNNPNLSLRCLSNKECKCQKGYYCTANSDKPKECSPRTQCDKVGCKNSQCKDIPITPRQKKSILKRLVEVANKNRRFDIVDEVEVSATLSMNLYWDVSSFLCFFLVISMYIYIN